MASGNLILNDVTIDLKTPTKLYECDDHTVYWLGITDKTAFRCNSYLLVDNDEAIIIDPGGRLFFEQVRSRVSQIIEPDKVSGMILSHQDPDVAASMVDWLDLNPAMTVFTSPRAQVLLPHYGRTDYAYYDIEESPNYALSSGRELKFIEAPFLHFPGAFVTYDSHTRILFSGDIWAALGTEWKLVVTDFESHIIQMNLFHLDYIPCNAAARGFVEKLADIAIDAILPQHGSVIGPDHVRQALTYLKNVQCGLDIIY